MAAALLAAGVTAAGFVVTRQPPASAPAVSRFVIPYPEGQARDVVRVSLAISPDGTHVAFVANREIYVRALSALEPRKLDRGVAKAASVPTSLAFSPDSRSLAYFDAGDETIKRIEISGGTPTQITSATSPVGISWSGDYVYFTVAGSIRRVRASGGEPQILIKTDPRAFQTVPQPLDEDRILFSIAPLGDEGEDRWTRAKIVVQRPGDATPTTILESASDPRYLPSGHLVYQSGGVLSARRFDPRTRSLGAAMSLVNGVMRASSDMTSGQAWYGISRLER